MAITPSSVTLRRELMSQCGFAQQMPSPCKSSCWTTPTRSRFGRQIGKAASGRFSLMPGFSSTATSCGSHRRTPETSISPFIPRRPSSPLTAKTWAAKSLAFSGGFTPQATKVVDSRLTLEQIKQAGPPRKISLGEASPPVAAAPGDTDFERAASWRRVQLPPDLELDGDPLLRMHYVGDVCASDQLNGKLLADDFYNGNDFEIGLRRYAPDIL